MAHSLVTFSSAGVFVHTGLLLSLMRFAVGADLILISRSERERGWRKAPNESAIGSV
jgi:hypothetical protein